MDKTLLMGVFCFLGEFLFVSKGSEVEHNCLVETIFIRLDEKSFSLNWSNCEFLLNHLSWLGFRIGSKTYRFIRSKIGTVLALETPRTLKQLRSFMGISNYLQRILPKFQIRSDQLHPSLKASNKNKLVRGESKQYAFTNILKFIGNITKKYTKCRIVEPALNEMPVTVFWKWLSNKR